MRWQTAREIDQEAAAWAASVDRGLSAGEQAELDAWLAGEARRAGAYARMRAVALETDRLAVLRAGLQDAAPRPPPRPSRRALFGAGAIAAGVAGLGAIGLLWRLHGRFRTRKGEVRQLALEDGSVVTLNTASLVEVSYGRQRREVRLLAGEALFDVARDPARPFVVVAGATEARALGTSFTVRHLRGEAVQVLVREGVVEVSRTDRVAARLRLAANMRAVSPLEMPKAGSAPLAAQAVPEREVHRELAWRDGRIAFEGETLAAAAAEFARYSDTRIVVEDPDLAREEIAGLYQSNDPVGFAEAVAASLNVRTEVSEGVVRILPAAS